jgi:hypothetical protein
VGRCVMCRHPLHSRLAPLLELRRVRCRLESPGHGKRADRGGRTLGTADP